MRILFQNGLQAFIVEGRTYGLLGNFTGKKHFIFAEIFSIHLHLF